MIYKFRAENRIVDGSMSEKICDIYDYFTFANQWSEKMSLTFGQLKSLFGEPRYITKNLEQQYEYSIVAEDEAGNQIDLTVYSGASGPSIGGNSGDPDTCAAADALAEYIRNAMAADYAYEGYYMDGPCMVKMGVKDGIPYFEEEELILTEEEFKDICRKLYS